MKGKKKSKILSGVLAFVMVMSLFAAFPITALAEAENGYTYTIRDGKATISKIDGSITGDVVIPDTLGGYPVTRIDRGIGEGSPIFDNPSAVTSITFPDSLIEVGHNTCFQCTSLTSVTIPEGVTSIGETAFGGCTSLTTVNFPSTLKIVGYFSFSGCTALTSITIPEGVTTISRYAFDNAGLTSVVIPGSVGWIDTNAFQNCASLESVFIPDGALYHIGADVFLNSSNVVIFCYENSFAHNYADTNGIPYELVAGVVITKTYTASGWVNMPAAVFKFAVTPVEADGYAYDANAVAGEEGHMPAVPDVTVGFTSSSMNMEEVRTVTQSSANTFFNIIFPHAGEYVYRVTERANTVTFEDSGTSGWIEEMTYSDKVYFLTVLVKMDGGVPVITHSFVSYENGEALTKTDDNIVFASTYTKTKKITDITADATLFVYSEVSGDIADTTLHLPYTVTVRAAFSAEDTSYKAYVIDENGSAVDDADEAARIGTGGADDERGYYWTFTNGVSQTLRLKHGQKLAFLDVPEGAFWLAVDELGSAAPNNLYLAGGSVTLGGNELILTSPGGNGESLSSISFPEMETLPFDFLPVMSIGGTAFENGAAFSNVRQYEPPTGIILNNLPYIGLAALALAALVLFAVLKSRKRREGYES